MKNLFFTVIFLFFLSNALGQNIVEKIFQDNFLVVENYIKLFEKIERENNTSIIINMDLVNKSVDFFQELTGIYSEGTPGKEFFYSPSRKNLKKWKVWYRKNKDKLYFDQKVNKIIKRE